MENILKKISKFDVTKITVDKNNVKLQIKVKSSEDLQAKEEEIKKTLVGYVVSITFFIQQPKKRKFRKVIGVASGKGGVGKSTIALHMAFELKERGFKVAILDADLYSPSIPVFLNIEKVPKSQDGVTIEPISTHNMQVLSMGLFLKPNQSPLWRHTMLSAGFRQFLEQGNWDCDYLIIDFPPGNSDLYSACFSIIPDIEFVLVGAPSKVVYSDVVRLYVALKALKLNVVGMIDNMSFDICEKCGYKNEMKVDYDFKGLEKIYSLPKFESFYNYSNDGYPENYVQKEEKFYFSKLIDLILK